MRHADMILQILGLVSILASGLVLSYMSAFGHQSVGMVLITGSLG